MVSRLASAIRVRSKLRTRLAWCSGVGSGLTVGCNALRWSRVLGPSVLEEDDEAVRMLVGVAGEGSVNVTLTGGRWSSVLFASRAARRVARPRFALMVWAVIGTGGPPWVSMPASSPYSHTRLKKR